MRRIETYPICGHHEKTINASGMKSDCVEYLYTTTCRDERGIEPVVIRCASHRLCEFSVDGVVIFFDCHSLSRVFTDSLPFFVQILDLREGGRVLARYKLTPFIFHHLFD